MHTQYILYIYISCGIQVMSLNTYFTFKLTSGNKRKQTSVCVCGQTSGLFYALVMQRVL